MQRHQEGEIAPANGPTMVSILRPCEHVRVPNRRRGGCADEATMISALTFESNSLFAPSLYPTGAFVRETFPDDDDNGSLRLSSSSSYERRSLDNSSGNNSNMMLQGLLNKRAELEAVEAKQNLQKRNMTNNKKKDPLSLFIEKNSKGDKKKKDKTTKDSKLGMGPVEVLLVWLVRKIRRR